MKLTPSAAMRARDVSRPRAEHLAEAEAAEASSGSRARPPAGETAGPDRNPAKAPGAPAGNERAGRSGYPRRRRGRSSR